MKYNLFLIGFLLLISASFAYAHVPFGQYAGTHAVALVLEPSSILVGEKVKMTFYIRDLHGVPASEAFVAAATIQEILPEGEEFDLFTTPAKTVTNGIYTAEYIFKEVGVQRIEFAFHRPDEPDVVRDAVFDVQIRKSLGVISYTSAGLIILLVLVFGVIAGKFLSRHAKSK